MCGAEDKHPNSTISELVDALTRVETESKHFTELPAGYDREILRTEAESSLFSENCGGQILRW